MMFQVEIREPSNKFIGTVLDSEKALYIMLMYRDEIEPYELIQLNLIHTSYCEQRPMRRKMYLQCVLLIDKFLQLS